MKWFAQVANGDSVNAASHHAGIIPRTFARQIERNHIDAENVIAIAIAYGTHPVRALVNTGYLDEEWDTSIDLASPIRTVTEEQLAIEVLRRMKIGMETSELTDDINEFAQRRSNTAGQHVSFVGDDDDALINVINDGSKSVAAQKRTDSLDEKYTQEVNP